MFFGTFSWSFVYVSLPFHIHRISTWDATSTLRWTGWILGISPLATVAMAPLWGRLAGRGNPKGYFVLVQSCKARGSSPWRPRTRCPSCSPAACSSA